MNNKNFCVYMHKFPNDKMYIGITCKNVNRRWENGRGYSKEHQNAIYNAIKKYGWDNIEHIVLFENLSEEEAKNKEVELIKKYNTYVHFENSNGYNMTLGGEGTLGHKRTENMAKINKERLLGRKGDNCPNSYSVICENIRYESITEFCKVNNLGRGMVEKWIKGKSRMPREWFEKDLRREFGEDLRIKTPQYRKTCEKIYYNGKVYNSQLELANKLNVSPATLCSWLSGKRKTPKDIVDNGIGRVNSELDINIKESESYSNSNQIEYDGKIYDTQVELANYLHVSKSTLNYWLRNKNNIPEKYKDKGLKYHNK